MGEFYYTLKKGQEDFVRGDFVRLPFVQGQTLNLSIPYLHEHYAYVINHDEKEKDREIFTIQPRKRKSV